MQVTYGHQITSDEDPYIDIAEKTSFALSNAGPPGNTPVDFFPFREYSSITDDCPMTLDPDD